MVDHDEKRLWHRVQASREDMLDSSVHGSSAIVQALVEIAMGQSSQGQDEEAKMIIRCAIGRAIMDAFEEALVSQEDDAASRSTRGVSYGTTSLRVAARRMLYSLCWTARRSQGNAIGEMDAANRDGRIAVAVPVPQQRSIMPGGRSMYELSQGAQGFQADSRTNLTNGAGMHMLMPVQPTYTTILDIVNETRLPYFRFLDLPPELRCMVYGFYFVDPHPPYNSPYADYDPLAPSFIQALTLVSQFIRYENLLHLYRGRPNAAFWPPDLTRIDLTFSLHLTIRTMHRPTLRTKRMRDMAMLLEPSPAAPLRSLHTVEIRMTLCPGVLMPIVLTIVPGTLRVSVSVRRDFDKEVSHPPDRTCGRMRFMCDACALRATCYAGITARLMGLGEGESLCLIRCALLAWRMEQIDWTRFREGGHGFPAQPGLP